ncbi:OmpA family protein [Algicola sagamiensis]|uniref:OmpA family protein n=1 Tax=Algicola sagamiensis TaxID=163869 RepID=UPI00035F507D|nr:OmpA family protein [Algicola sagamiensis]
MNNLPSRKQPSVLGITQKQYQDINKTDEYVFCDLRRGAWRCPNLTPKTPITQRELHKPEKEDYNASPSVVTKHQKPKALNTKKSFSLFTKVHFDFDSATLKLREQERLKALFQKLAQKEITLVGYTDDIGTENYNDKLALNRAKSVKSLLLELGVSSQQITISGNGVCCYLVPNSSEDKRGINRRVEVLIK